MLRSSQGPALTVALWSSTRLVCTSSTRRAPVQLGGVAGAIYRWCGIHSDVSFADSTKRCLKDIADSLFVRYKGKSSGDDKAVVHCIAPDLRAKPFHPKSTKAKDLALKSLQDCYLQVFKEFVGSHSCTTLRLCPLAGGIFSGEYADDIPAMTFEAIVLAFDGLSKSARMVLMDRDVHMCIYFDVERPLLR